MPRLLWHRLIDDIGRTLAEPIAKAIENPFDAKGAKDNLPRYDGKVTRDYWRKMASYSKKKDRWRGPMPELFRSYCGKTTTAKVSDTFDDIRTKESVIDLLCWLRFVGDFRIMPQFMTRFDATAVFHRSNSSVDDTAGASGLSESAVGGRLELEFEEFATCLRACAIAPRAFPEILATEEKLRALVSHMRLQAERMEQHHINRLKHVARIPGLEMTEVPHFVQTKVPWQAVDVPDFAYNVPQPAVLGMSDSFRVALEVIDEVEADIALAVVVQCLIHHDIRQHAELVVARRPLVNKFAPVRLRVSDETFPIESPAVPGSLE